MASLPDSERLFVAKRPPLSRLRLDRRLKALAPEDAETLRLMEEALALRHYRLDTEDAEVTRRARRAMDHVTQPALRAILRDRMEIRTVIAALRRRRAGEAPPPPGWGHGRFSRRIIAHWAEPTFGLDPVFPWLREAHGLLEQDDALGFERLVLTVTERLMRRHGAGHDFDIEAVVIYVLTWNIYDRWARTNAEAASRRFNALAEAALAGHDAQLAKS
ncbi:hypothetical protein ATO3_05295 [Marinibacterium profundimaris]|uniref:V-type ATP synthase subunit A n=2 Tax=Marinibacterium profundimaris TaxID=1679460 RepID=A0A225NQR4_9RHOB|nr:hypothetical protein ATO3_05295 [Marinibacterium profundimaris]